MFLQSATPVKAWGLATHMFIVSEVMEHISNDSWAEAFDYYSPEVLSGSTTPDQAWQDWDNHLYYPDTGEYNAPQAAAKWYNYTRDNFTAGNWEDGFFAMGVMSHYFCDPCIPVHTGPDWSGHGGYEKDINENLDILEFPEPSEAIVENVSQLVVDSATHSHQYYAGIVPQYENDDSRALSTNETLKTITEECLSLAINGCLSLFYSLTQYTDAPDVSVTYDYVALFDWAHSNDYIDYDGEVKLVSVNQTLARNHFEMKRQTTAFTASDLDDVDLLIITCGLDAYTSNELTAIANWASSGEKALIVASRGDYSTYQDTARPNQILEAIDSHIRVNDDNVYMHGTYQLHYNDLTDIPSDSETLGLTDLVNSITFYSPSSLYFTADDLILTIIHADVTAYQTNQNEPDITVIWDDTIDGANGKQIPLAAVEEIGDLRLLVAGTTFFSDFDYGKTQFDNVQLFENYLDWAVGSRDSNNVPQEDNVGPRISDVSWTPSSPEPGQTLSVSATVTDPGGVASVSLKYEVNEQTITVPMNLDSNDVYKAELSDVTAVNLTIRITALDNDGNEGIRASFTIWEGDTTPTDTTPLLNTFMIAGILVVVGVVVVVIVIIMRKR